jgi:hypothetical protein
VKIGGLAHQVRENLEGVFTVASFKEFGLTAVLLTASDAALRIAPEQVSGVILSGSIAYLDQMRQERSTMSPEGLAMQSKVQLACEATLAGFKLVNAARCAIGKEMLKTLNESVRQNPEILNEAIFQKPITPHSALNPAISLKTYLENFHRDPIACEIIPASNKMIRSAIEYTATRQANLASNLGFVVVKKSDALPGTVALLKKAYMPSASYGFASLKNKVDAGAGKNNRPTLH